ncbi:MAG: peptidoglycan-associated lipoprotein Pal [Desulfobacteraceae bacterium]|nr:peptidoglycan-associated lipoprotein Pal [Desulfobacteraceae bacterium]
MKRYFSRLFIIALICILGLSFGCSSKKTDLNEGVTQEQVSEQERLKAEQAEKEKKAEEERLKAEELERQKKLEQQKREEERKKEALRKFSDVNVYFTFDSSEISEEARMILEEKSQWLMENNNVKITVEGHCDSRGTTQYNLALGERRAESVKTYLVALGIDSARISTISYGEERPAVEGSGEDVWAKNRRAEFVIDSGL